MWRGIDNWMDVFSLTLLAHLIGVIVGVGGATMSDALFFKTIRNRHVSKDEYKLLKEAGKVIWTGYGLTILSGIGLLLNQYFSTGSITYWDSAYFQGKLVLAGVIAGNGVLFHGKILPFMKKHLEEDMREKEFCEKFWLFSLTGSISIVSWWTTVILAVLSPSFSLLYILSLYLLVLASGALFAYLMISHVVLGERGGSTLKDLIRPFEELRGENNREGFPDTKYIFSMSAVIIALLVATSFQTVQVFGTIGDTQGFGQEDADVEVMVGEMYFQQEGLPENKIEAQVGDVIRFYNEGDIAHTVTISEYGIDKKIEPGEEVYLKVDKPSEEARVNCRYHSNHEGTLTVEERN